MRRARVRFNYNDYLLLPEDKRYEILDGDLLVVAAPSTEHQSLSLRLEVALFHHVKDKGLGQVLHAPCDVVLSEENVLQPDILFVSKERSGIIGEMNIQGPPDLVIEILSTGSRNKDVDLKRKLYGRFGVLEYWMVDPEHSTVVVLVSSEAGYVTAGAYGKADQLCSPLFPDLVLPLSEIFV